MPEHGVIPTTETSAGGDVTPVENTTVWYPISCRRTDQTEHPSGNRYGGRWRKRRSGFTIVQIQCGFHMILILIHRISIKAMLMNFLVPSQLDLLFPPEFSPMTNYSTDGESNNNILTVVPQRSGEYIMYPDWLCFRQTLELK